MVRILHHAPQTAARDCFDERLLMTRRPGRLCLTPDSRTPQNINPHLIRMNDAPRRALA